MVPDGAALDDSHLRTRLTPDGESEEHQAGDRRVERLQDAVTRAERECLEVALELHGWNITRAAKQLDISRQHLHNRIRLHGLVRPAGDKR